MEIKLMGAKIRSEKEIAIEWLDRSLIRDMLLLQNLQISYWKYISKMGSWPGCHDLVGDRNIYAVVEMIATCCLPVPRKRKSRRIYYHYYCYYNYYNYFYDHHYYYYVRD